MNIQEQNKFEFLLTLDGNIICQRFFNVRDFNPKAKSSMDLYHLIRQFSNDIEYQLKMKTVVYMMDNMDEIMTNPTMLETSYTDGPEHINIFVKQGDMTICHRQFNAKVYPPKVRYTVDVRPHLKNLLMSLTDIFSSKNLTLDYMGVPLTV